MNLVRGLIFNFFYATSVIVYGIIINLVVPFLSIEKRRKVLRVWPVMIEFLLKSICGIRYQVEGLENIPNEPVVIISNHQSSWETIILYKVLGPLCTVLKKELTYIPIFGWTLRWAQPIAIDRSKKATALKEILRQGKNRLAAGLSVMIFPEGTRVNPKDTKPHMPGGAMLSVKANAKALPVAHNSGCHWPAHKISKTPGVIRVKIGEPIDPTGMNAKQLNKQLENWINEEKAKLVC